MVKNRANEVIIQDYHLYLRRSGYSKKTRDGCALNKLRYFLRDKNFSKITLDYLKSLFYYLHNKKYSDPYLSSIGTEIRRFFKYLQKKGLNQNLMFNLVIPAHRKKGKHLSIDYLKLMHKRFHPRC